ncbi:hypothetical protein EC973_003353 [Apophysomyces ossiformis]|uniref:Uncharacterized protein n=1 Tax=Apophysomyces ossiformis TaxID=679940 RepID=A0A8H7BXC1_9FUNG|nr:hypothetical protein EC973_003353 [Apophysomyces ossiformis]
MRGTKLLASLVCMVLLLNLVMADPLRQQTEKPRRRQAPHAKRFNYEDCERLCHGFEGITQGYYNLCYASCNTMLAGAVGFAVWKAVNAQLWDKLGDWLTSGTTCDKDSGHDELKKRGYKHLAFYNATLGIDFEDFTTLAIHKNGTVILRNFGKIQPLSNSTTTRRDLGQFKLPTPKVTTFHFGDEIASALKQNNAHLASLHTPVRL